MRIEFRRSGGVAGIIQPSKHIDTATLAEPEASGWSDLVAAADFFRLPPRIADVALRDAFSYAIKVEQEGRSHTVQAQKGAGPPALDRLIERLEHTQS